MRYVEAGGARVSAIGLGTWQFGAREWGYGAEYAQKTAGEIVHRALDLGINLIDTAEIYGMGESERIVGKAIEGRRDEVFLATKVFPLMPLAQVVEWRGRQSARRLGVDTIDLYQVHWPNPIVPYSMTMDGMQQLRSAGVIDFVGVSNYSASQWREAEERLGAPVLSNQIRYNLTSRGPELETIPYAQRKDRLVIAYSPLAQGFLGAKYGSENPPGGIRATNVLFLPENLERAEPLLGALREIAAAHDASAAQVALAWVISHDNVVAIPGASSVEQLESNAAACDLDLSDEEITRLDRESDAFSPRAGPAVWPRIVRARLPF